MVKYMKVKDGSMGNHYLVNIRKYHVRKSVMKKVDNTIINQILEDFESDPDKTNISNNLEELKGVSIFSEHGSFDMFLGKNPPYSSNYNAKIAVRKSGIPFILQVWKLTIYPYNVNCEKDDKELINVFVDEYGFIMRAMLRYVDWFNRFMNRLVGRRFWKDGL